MQPGSFQLRPDAIHPSGTWYHAGLRASYARFVIDLRKRNQHDAKSCGATLSLQLGFANERASATMRRENKRKKPGERREQSTF
jgi:hypothetical protein